MENKELISKMTLEEKASLCSGKDFWQTKAVPRLDIPSIMMCDGPHGLRQEINDTHKSKKAVCFPAACLTACSFDRDLLYQLGTTLGEACVANNIDVLLGPAVNLKRSPLCGRNFEYFSEDPFLTSTLATQYIQGVQTQNIGTCLKHFAVNNQETRRMTVDAKVEQRPLRELYLACFEQTVKEAKPWSVMCSYNRINGVFSSENPWLLTDVLRKEWGFEGAVVTDWGACNDRVIGLDAGVDLEMPFSHGVTDLEIINAVKEGTLSEEVLDQTVSRLLTLITRCQKPKKNKIYDLEAQDKLAQKVAAESMVLLKNDGVLPLCSKQNIAFIGAFAKSPRYQGGGSSHIHAAKVTGALDAASRFASLQYAKGYDVKTDQVDEALQREAGAVAKAADVAVVFVGLPDHFESEGYDRTHLSLPHNQNQLVRKICAVQPNTVVVLHNGSPVTMPWLSQVRGVLEAYLGGQAVGAATADILFGIQNPCGKLAESFPLRLEDTPAYLQFPGYQDITCYQEGILVGYRYYDSKQCEVLFPFGYGLSYTDFAYDNLTLSQTKVNLQDAVTVTLDVTNTGTRAGKEVVQLYLKDQTRTVLRPSHELKNFVKVWLEPGETKTVSMQLSPRDFCYYNEALQDWTATQGNYEIQIGKSSREILLQQSVQVAPSPQPPISITGNTSCKELLRNPKTAPVIKQALQKLTGLDLSDPMGQAMIEELPLHSMRSFSATAFTQQALDSLIDALTQAAANT